MKAKNIEEFFGTLQQSTVEAWKEHLNTDKYSSHIALNDFYEDIVELVDTLIEDYMGKYGKVKEYKNLMSSEKMGAIKYLEELRELTTDGNKNLIDKEDTELHSDIDAILSLIDSTLYKLKELTENRIKNLSDFIKESIQNVNEGREEIYGVAFNGLEDKHGEPITVEVRVPREYSSDFEDYLQKEAGNTIAHADGRTNDFELDW